MGQPGGKRLTRLRPLIALLAASSLAAACSSSTHHSATPPTTVGGPLVAPGSSTTQDALYFQDLAKVDPSLATYVNTEQSVALQALITDGSAFCAFLKRGGGIDNAMESVVIGASSVESQTHLPASVQTYNAIDAVALVVLCPTEQSLVPSADRARIQQLDRQLSSSPLPTAAGG